MPESGASNPEESMDTPNPSDIQSLFETTPSSPLTLEFSSLPSNPYIGEIITVTVKLTPIDIASGNIEYTLQNEQGIRIFSDTPRRKIKEDGIYDTFYFIVQDSDVKLPDITATVSATGAGSTPLAGSSFKAVTLSPPSGFANILAERFDIVNYKTTPYNNENNIVIFTAKAARSNIGTFSIPNALKQGFESKISNVSDAQMTYYAVIPNDQPTLSFSYFNLNKHRYEAITIPIVVDDDTVSTQSDLSPTDTRHTELKVAAALILIIALVSMFYWRRNIWYLYLTALPLFYTIFVFLPNQTICIKQGSAVYLLPIKNGTIFEVTNKEEHLEAEKEVGDFIKVHLNNDKVGWINKHDICTN